METEMVITALTEVITSVTAIVTGAVPLVLGVIGTLAGVNIGIRLFKKFANKAA